jgi:CubicO group peptidase (beta-lactamase class C family)
MNKLLIATTFALFTSCCGLKMNQEIPEKSQKVKAFLDKETSESVIPGIQYIIMDSSRLIFNYAGGLADIKNQIPMNSKTTMMAFSMTKTLTAVAILQLVGRGELGLDDRIDKYLPNNPYGTSITIRHLLSHTSGIPNPIPLKWVHLANTHDNFDEDSTLAEILEDNPDISFDPGEEYAYSNISYWLLGKIIEKVSGQPYTNYMMENVFAPLGLTQDDLNYIIPDSSYHAKGYLAKWSFYNLIKVFVIDTDLLGDYEENWLHIKNIYLNGPAFGGLIGSARAFSKFLQDQLKNKSVLLNQETKKLLYTQQETNDGEPIEMTLGWHIGEFDEVLYYFKEGGGAGYHCEMRVYPDQGVATVIIVNKTSFNSKKYLNLIDIEYLHH